MPMYNHFTQPIQIVEHLIGRTDYLSGVAVSLSRAAAGGQITESEVFQQIDIVACDFRRHLDTLLGMLTPSLTVAPPPPET